jgi:hypothetical protein
MNQAPEIAGKSMISSKKSKDAIGFDRQTYDISKSSKVQFEKCSLSDNFLKEYDPDVSC